MSAGFPRLYAISDSRAAGGLPHREIVQEFLEGGARWIQIREKVMPSGPFLEEVESCVERARGTGCRLVVNDRPDIAWLAGAAGVHLGAEDLPAAEARRVLGGAFLLGVSTHSEEEAVRGSRTADYVAIGPILASPTAKRDWRPLGIEVLRRLRGKLPVPLVAIGGIRLEGAASILAAGADSVAVISDLLQGPSIRRRVRQFLDILGEPEDPGRGWGG